MLSTSGKYLLYDNSLQVDKLCLNIMINIPGTEEGLVVIKTMLEEGINVNVTLLFSLERYVAGLETNLKALVQRQAQGAVTRQCCIGSEFYSESHRKILKPLGRFPEAG